MSMHGSDEGDEQLVDPRAADATGEVAEKVCSPALFLAVPCVYGLLYACCTWEEVHVPASGGQIEKKETQQQSMQCWAGWL